MTDEPPFILCERHPDCLFQGGCDCKRQQIRERAIEQPPDDLDVFIADQIAADPAFAAAYEKARQQRTAHPDQPTQEGGSDDPRLVQ